MTDPTPYTSETILRPVERLHPNDMMFVTLTDDLKKFHLRLAQVERDGAERGLPSNAARYDFTERFPERRSIAGHFDTRWEVAATDTSSLLIRYAWPQTRLQISQEAAQVYTYHLASVESQRLRVRRSAEYHYHSQTRSVRQAFAIPTPQYVSHREMRDAQRLMTHQCVATDNAVDNEGYAYFMEQGTGKTLAVIARVEQEAQALRDSGETRMYRALIVAPKNVRMNWAKEFERFGTKSGTVTVLRGGPLERIRSMIESLVPSKEGQLYTVVVCSYDALSLSWDTLQHGDWDLAVLDESHYIKWPRTKRAQFAFKLRDVSRQRMCLTGTPVCNTPIDLYSQLEFLAEGASGFTSFEAFRSFYGVFATSGRDGSKRLVDVQNLPFMRERLARYAFIVRKEEALPDLPEKRYDVCEVEMASEQAEIYREVATQLYHELEDESRDENRVMNVNNVLTRLLRLAQITSGFVTYDKIIDLDTGETLEPKPVVESIEPNTKLDALMDMLKDDEWPETSKKIIWATWVHDIKQISDRLRDAKIDFVQFYGGTSDADRLEAERRFNCDPGCRVFVGNPAAGGTGLTLLGYPPGDPDACDTNCDHVIYYSQNWSAPARQQSEDRPHRRGTRVSVRITDLCVPNTIDEEIRARVTNKKLVAMQVQDLREILNRVLGVEVIA